MNEITVEYTGHVKAITSELKCQRREDTIQNWIKQEIYGKKSWLVVVSALRSAFNKNGCCVRSRWAHRSIASKNYLNSFTWQMLSNQSPTPNSFACANNDSLQFIYSNKRPRYPEVLCGGVWSRSKWGVYYLVCLGVELTRQYPLLLQWYTRNALR